MSNWGKSKFMHNAMAERVTLTSEQHKSVKLSCCGSKKLHGFSFLEPCSWGVGNFKNNFPFCVKRCFSLAQLLQNQLSKSLPVPAIILGRGNHGYEGVVDLFLRMTPHPCLHPWPFPNHLLLLLITQNICKINLKTSFCSSLLGLLFCIQKEQLENVL